MNVPYLSAVSSLALFLTTLSSYAHASPQNNFYIQQALSRYYATPQDARTLSLGGSRAPVCNDSACLYQNPAGLGFSRHLELSGSFGHSSISGHEFISDQPIEQTEKRGYGVLSIPLGASDEAAPRSGNLSFGFSRYQGKTDDQIKTTPDGHLRSFAYGYAPAPNFALGYSFTFYDDQLHTVLSDLHSHARILHIFGAQYLLDDQTVVGAFFRLGIGQSDTEDIQFRSDGLSYPRQYTGGVGVTKNFSIATFFASLEYSHLSSPGTLKEVSTPVVIGGDEDGYLYSVRTGIEKELLSSLFIRAGLHWYQVAYDFHREDLSGLSGRLRGASWSGGLGYLIKQDRSTKLRIDYGVEYTPEGSGDIEHQVTLAYLFS